MKELPEGFYKQHGLKMLCITLNFYPTTGMSTGRTASTVTHSDRACPASGCDFIFNGSSCASENVFERVGIPKVFSGLTPERPHSVFFYCLPENEELAMTKAKAAMRESVRVSLLKWQGILKATQENYDKDFGE